MDMHNAFDSLEHDEIFKDTLFSKRNATFLKLPFFWRRVYASESGGVHHFDRPYVKASDPVALGKSTD